MNATPLHRAAFLQPTPEEITLSGAWTARELKGMEAGLAGLSVPVGKTSVLDVAQIDVLDTAGAWLLQRLLLRLRSSGTEVTLRGLRPAFAPLLASVAQHMDSLSGQAAQPPVAPPTELARIGHHTALVFEQALAMLSFVGESALALVTCLRHPSRLRWRPVLFNLRSAGFDALPIVGLLSFLLGVVVAYQGADQLRQYGANIFVVDLVGLSMLREFAPLITAIIIAGRSGSAYAAQIGTMAVTEEIDAMTTLGIAPLELLVLPKIVALVLALPHRPSRSARQ